MTLQRVLTRMREGKVAALDSSWADQQGSGDQQHVGDVKKLIKSAVIWVRPTPLQTGALWRSSRSALATPRPQSRRIPTIAPSRVVRATARLYQRTAERCREGRRNPAERHHEYPILRGIGVSVLVHLPARQASRVRRGVRLGVVEHARMGELQMRTLTEH
jgi:hypothetical protein